MSNFKEKAILLEELAEQGVDKELLNQVSIICDEKSFFENKSEILVEELEKFKAMADFSPCTISLVKSDNTYLSVNKTLSDLYGVHSSEFTGKRVGFNSNYGHFYDFSKELFSVTEESISREVSATINSSERTFYLVGTKLKEGSEAIIMGLDVTELSSLKGSMALMERLSSLGEMVAGIVHEVNNPLTVIQNKGRLIFRYLERGETKKVEDAAQSISDNCSRMVKIIDGVKGFAREAEADPFTNVKIHEVLLEAQGLLHAKLRENDVRIVLPVGAGPVIYGNRTQLFQVFINLITNAIDAISDCKEKWIRIETRIRKDGKVEINFRDSGGGISEELKNKIFQSFYTTKQNGKGTGLGLSLSLKIVEKHGGMIEVEDEANTCFKVTLAA